LSLRTEDIAPEQVSGDVYCRVILMERKGEKERKKSFEQGQLLPIEDTNFS
jgi:hypothetical protein